VAKLIKRIKLADLVPTGVTELNCACSDNPFGGYRLGTLVNLIGQYSAGKTVSALTTLAQVANTPRFNDHRLILDDAEHANDFDIEKLFGTKLADRLELDIKSHSVQDYYGNMLDVIGDGTPWIYVLDSYDSLKDSDEDAKAEKEFSKKKKKKAEGEADTKTKGSFHTGKARIFKRILNHVKGDMNNCLLMVISQVIQNMDRQNKFQPKFTKTGGEALKHMTFHEVWLSYGDKIKDTTTKLQIGRWTKCQVTKNKLTGKKRNATWPVYDQIGIDDIASSINYLVRSGWWPKVTSQTINAKELELRATKEKLIQHIESSKEVQKTLKQSVGRCWKHQETEALLDRKPRFS
jgi:RecA/RadA recombinase